MNKMKYLLVVILYSLIISSLSAKTTEFSILFTANINGTLQNCNCGKEPLGGIGRVKTFIDTYRKHNPNTIVIDGGDYLNSYPFMELNTAMLKSLGLINYDVFVPGDQEFVEGNAFFNVLEKSLGNQLVISNSNLDNNGIRSFKFAESTVHIHGFLSQSAFVFIDIPQNLKLSSSLYFEKNPLPGQNIVVFHGRYSEAEQAVRDNKWIDLVLLAHDQVDKVNKVSNTLIVGSGRDSEFITVIKGQKGTKDWKYEIYKEKMKLSIKEDVAIVTLIDEYQKKLTDSRSE